MIQTDARIFISNVNRTFWVSIAINSSPATAKIKISLFGQIRDRENIELTEMSTRFRPGEKYTYLLTYHKELGLVLNAQVFCGLSLVSINQTLFDRQIILYQY
jgi:hypothetical protein